MKIICPYHTEPPQTVKIMETKRKYREIDVVNINDLGPKEQFLKVCETCKIYLEEINYEKKNLNKEDEPRIPN